MSSVEKYTINISMNGVSKEIPSSDISFSLSDSIHSLYSRGSLTINDNQGWGLEGRGLTMGSSIQLELGYGDERLISSFVINSMETRSMAKSSQLGGEIRVDLIHESFAKSRKISESYDEPPSSIMETLFNYSFPSTLIERTLPSPYPYLYRPHLTEEEFIRRILMPNSLSSDGTISPFFCFIDLKGELHYESLIYMLSKNPLSKMFLGHQEAYDNYYEKVFSFYPFTETLEDVKDSIIYEFSYINPNTKEYKKENLELADNHYGGYPVYKTTVTPSQYFDGFISSSFLSSTKAETNNKQKGASLPEKAVVVTPLYTNYTSGRVVSIKAVYGNGYHSYSYSKNYIIERSAHIWNGEENNGYTELVISKVLPEFPADSIIEEGIYSND